MPINKHSSSEVPWKDQEETKKTANKATNSVFKEPTSLNSGMDFIAMVLKKGSIRNSSKDQQ